MIFLLSSVDGSGLTGDFAEVAVNGCRGAGKFFCNKRDGSLELKKSFFVQFRNNVFSLILIQMIKRCFQRDGTLIKHFLHQSPDIHGKIFCDLQRLLKWCFLRDRQCFVQNGCTASKDFRMYDGHQFFAELIETAVIKIDAEKTDRLSGRILDKHG